MSNFFSFFVDVIFNFKGYYEDLKSLLVFCAVKTLPVNRFHM